MKQTIEFIAIIKDNKYALYSLSKEKFITDYIFDKITYIPNVNYFVVKNSEVVYLINSEGEKLNIEVTYPNNFDMEGLYHYRKQVKI
ncbi:MAG: hypothetical protein L6V95_07580 [Candidatus Melainabacteria bacterium]|nr:MAG: hypothetical protein L6V95_07580 [Candidatus Melainabacteria bacterium]